MTAKNKDISGLDRLINVGAHLIAPHASGKPPISQALPHPAAWESATSTWVRLRDFAEQTDRKWSGEKGLGQRAENADWASQLLRDGVPRLVQRRLLPARE